MPNEARTAMHAFLSRPQFTARHTVAQHCAFEPHAHAAFTVTAVLAGRMEASIGADALALTAGEVALTSLGQTHAAQAFDIDFVSVRINPLLINELVAELGLMRATPDIGFRASRVTDDTLAQLARAMAAEMAATKVGHEAMLDTFARQMAIHLLRAHLTVRKSAQIELSRAGPVDRRLRRALEFMHDNFARELAIEEIAAAAYLSEYHFARLFKQITRQTPHAYLANLRLEQARRLLAETALAISEIATRVGYQSQSHFTKIFKSVTGVTPRAYREDSRHKEVTMNAER